MSFNLYYIRAAIQERTGQVLKFDRIRKLLVEEGLISKQELERNPLSKEFEGYGRYYATEDCSVAVPLSPERFIPDLIEEGFDDAV
tara:strand:- start:306 stop:563 length:258 start_codon:yes stop_codon:yes gene_type:complete